MGVIKKQRCSKKYIYIVSDADSRIKQENVIRAEQDRLTTITENLQMEDSLPNQPLHRT